MGSLLPARAVVIPHFSMQKMAVISDVVVLCEEVEVGYDVTEYPNGTVRRAVVRCKPVRVFKGALDEGKEFTAKYSGISRLPRYLGMRVEQVNGVVEEIPSAYFPAGRALLFLKVTPEVGIYLVQGAKLIQQDEIFDLGGDHSWLLGWYPSQQYPENSELGDCLKYGEAELVADYLKGMALLADPLIPPQFEVIYRKDPLANDPVKTRALALVLSVIPLVMIRAYPIFRSRLPKRRAFRGSVLVLAMMVAVGMGVQIYAFTTIWRQCPVRWANVRTGMTLDDLRCFVTSDERDRGRRMSEEGACLLLQHVEGINMHGSWSLRVGYDENRVIKSATISYRGDFGWLIPSRRMGAAK